MSSEIVIYTDLDGIVETKVRLEGETLWLTQTQLEELFDTDRTSIVKHIKNILGTGELEEVTTCAKFTQVRNECLLPLPCSSPYQNPKKKTSWYKS